MTTQPDILARLRERKWEWFAVERMSDGELSGVYHDGNAEVRALLDIAEAGQGTKRWLDTFNQEELDRIPTGLLLNLGGLMSKLAALDAADSGEAG